MYARARAYNRLSRYETLAISVRRDSRASSLRVRGLRAEPCSARLTVDRWNAQHIVGLAAQMVRAAEVAPAVTSGSG